MSTEAKDTDQEPLPELVARLRQELKSMRSAATEPGVLLRWVIAAAAAIEARIDPAAPAVGESERAALMAVQGMTYTVAADCWPGWEVAATENTRPSVDLCEGLALARRSCDLVRRLDLGPIREATGQWLIGAYYIALGESDAAISTLSLAASQYQAGAAPGLVWLARGYIAIAYESAHRARPQGTPGFDEVLNALANGGFQDAAQWRDQLNVARRVFT